MEKTAKEGNWSQDASELSLCLSQAHLIANLGVFMHQALRAGALRGLGGDSLGKPLKKVSVRISDQTGKSES